MPEQIVCRQCGSIDDYRIIPSGPNMKAICNGCDRYIKFIQQHNKSTQNLKPTIIMNTGQGFYGSICLDDLFAGHLAKGSNGKTYICLDDLVQPPFNKGKTNGKTYVNIGVWINEGVDEFGNVAGITLSQTKQEVFEKVKKTYIGNLRRSGPAVAQQPTATSPVAQPMGPQQAAYNDLPF